MRYLFMVHPPNTAKRIAEIRDLIARAETRMQKLQAKSEFEPGTARLVHVLTNTIRKYRRELQKALGSAKQQSQLRRQQTQLQQAQRDAPANRSGELPERQDQEARDPASDQGVEAGQ
jgi:tRNA U55 pseudouridine synthase TruB